MNSELIATMDTVADGLIAQGAAAVALTGSHARGDALPESDVDLIALGTGSDYLLQQVGGQLIAVSWQSVADCRAAFRDPSKVGSVILGWRGAIILRDPMRQAAALQSEARDWSWESLGDTTNRWVAEALTGYAEEAHKLAGSINAGRWWTAAVQRSLLALHMAPIIAVHERILYETENTFGSWSQPRLASRGVRCNPLRSVWTAHPYQRAATRRWRSTPSQRRASGRFWTPVRLWSSRRPAPWPAIRSAGGVAIASSGGRTGRI